MDKDTLKKEAHKWRAWYDKGQRTWSSLHHGALFGSIICSLTAGALLQIDAAKRGAGAAVLTSVAAALTGIATSGGFERKWRSNRLSRSRVDTLLIDLDGTSANLSDLAAQLKEIISKHDVEIVGERPAAKAVHSKHGERG